MNEVTTILTPTGMKTSRLVVLGLGAKSKLDRGVAYRATATVAKTLAGKERKQVAYYVSDGWPLEVVEAGICGALVGCVGQDLYRSERKMFPCGEMLWSEAEAEAVQGGWIQAEAINLARKLVNEPAGEIYPESFAVVARRVAHEVGLEIETWDVRRLEQERCGSLLAVGRASPRTPRL